MKRLDWCGIDVAKNSLAVAVLRAGETAPREETFPNDRRGRKRLVRWLVRPGRPVRACLESTGTYGRDLAILLAQTAGVEVMVANPRRVKRFAESEGKRSKNDRVDARVILEFARRMEFVAWEPPSQLAWDLQAISRRLGALAQARAREKNRRHAGEQTATLSAVVARGMQRMIAWIDEEQQELLRDGLELLHSDGELDRKYRRLLSIPGFGPLTVVRLLGELAVTPAHLRPRQWVAMAGLDPVSIQSGESSRNAAISRQGNGRLRQLLFLPALCLVRLDPHARAFYERLLAAGKPPRVAQVAVMRKLLHGIWAMLHHDEDYDGRKLFGPLPHSDGSNLDGNRRRRG
jgi:transposase